MKGKNITGFILLLFFFSVKISAQESIIFLGETYRKIGKDIYYMVEPFYASNLDRKDFEMLDFTKKNLIPKINELETIILKQDVDSAIQFFSTGDLEEYTKSVFLDNGLNFKTQGEFLDIWRQEIKKCNRMMTFDLNICGFLALDQRIKNKEILYLIRTYAFPPNDINAFYLVIFYRKKEKMPIRILSLMARKNKELVFETDFVNRREIWDRAFDDERKRNKKQ